jgi:hypothetical protein
MDEYVVQESVEDGIMVRIVADMDPQNPREMGDMLGVFVDWHRRDQVGDRHIDDGEKRALERGGWKTLVAWLKRTKHAVCVLPVALYDHSGWHVWVGSKPHVFDSAGWDSGQVGFIYATREQVALIGAPLDSVERQLRAEIEELDEYFTGQVFGIKAYLPVTQDEEDIDDWEEVDACWGYFGLDHTLTNVPELRAQAAAIRQQRLAAPIRVEEGWVNA